jgi:hypothetical protein
VVGSILRSRLWVLRRPKPDQNAMSKSEDLIMTAYDWINPDQCFNDHNHAGEVRPDRITRQYRGTGTVAICPVGSQIPFVLSIPTGTGCPEGHVVSHDSADRGFGRHMSATGIRKPIPSIQPGPRQTTTARERLRCPAPF